MIDRLIFICELTYVQLYNSLNYYLDKWLYYLENDLGSIFRDEYYLKENLILLDKKMKIYLALVNKIIMNNEGKILEQYKGKEFFDQSFLEKEIKSILLLLSILVFSFSILLLFSSVSSFLFCITISINYLLIISYYILLLVFLLSTEISIFILRDLIDVIGTQASDDYIKSLKLFQQYFLKYKIDDHLFEYKGFMLKLREYIDFLRMDLGIKAVKKELTNGNLLLNIIEACYKCKVNYLSIILLPLIFIYLIYKIFYLNKILFLIIKILCWSISYISYKNYQLDTLYDCTLLILFIILLSFTCSCVYLLHRLIILWTIHILNNKHIIFKIILYPISWLLFIFILYIQCFLILLICQEITYAIFHIIYNERIYYNKGEIDIKQILKSFILSKNYYLLLNSYIPIFLFFYINLLKKKWAKYYQI